MQAFRLALSFLTVIPVGVSKDFDSRLFSKSVKYMPLVGLVIGLILAGLGFLASFKFKDPALSAVIVTGLIAITRALHLDGLADTFDGMLGGGSNRDRIIEIMKDSRVGSFGAVAIVGDILLKVALLVSVPGLLKLETVIAAPLLARWSAYMAIVSQPYAGAKGGLGSLFMEKKSPQEILMVSAITLGITAVLLKLTSIVLVIAMVLFLYIYTKLIKRRIGGMTGDTLGALIELSEVLVLLVVAGS